MNLETLPQVNATLNTTSAVFLVAGYLFIRRKKIHPHILCMLSAVLSSTLFLGSYLYYHAHHGSTAFQGTGAVRIFYFSILISHTILAVVVVPLVVITLFRAFKKDFVKHAKIARVTLPVWLYVSVTGVMVYWMLYQL